MIRTQLDSLALPCLALPLGFPLRLVITPLSLALADLFVVQVASVGPLVPLVRPEHAYGDERPVTAGRIVDVLADRQFRGGRKRVWRRG
jgi:hypothetical protein